MPESESPFAQGRLIALGDIHGCVHAFDALIEAIAPTPRDQLVFLGDMIDQGPDSREVLDRILELKRRTTVVLIQGNHEEMLLAARGSEQARRYWEMCGGVSTINSYRFGGGLEDIPQAHWDLLDECLPYLETDEGIYTHANYLPELPMPLQPGSQLRWGLFEPTAMRPHCSGKPVVVGHTEQRDGEILDLGFALCIDTACWRYGWLTAVDLAARRTWQASRWGRLRDESEPGHRQRLSEILRAGRAPEPAAP